MTLLLPLNCCFLRLGKDLRGVSACFSCGNMRPHYHARPSRYLLRRVQHPRSSSFPVLSLVDHLLMRPPDFREPRGSSYMTLPISPPCPQSQNTPVHPWYRFSSSLPTQRRTIQLRRTKMTLSPLKNILLTKRSLLTPRPPALFFSVHISLTFSSTMLQCRSNALTRARSFLLLRHEIRT